MRLERVQTGDLILARIKGRSIYGEVIEVTEGEVNFRPLCAAAGWRHASAREIVAHWRRTGRHHRTADEPDPIPKEQLSLQIWT